MLDLECIEIEMAARVPESIVSVGYVPDNGKEEAWVRFSDTADVASTVEYVVTRDNFDGDMIALSAQRVRSDLFGCRE